MILLPPDFQFSQRSLQDYVDCRRRFQLRYLDQLSWPAVEAEPLIEHEHHLRSGADFHRLIQRYLLGVPGERLSKMLDSNGPGNNDLKRWWGNFLQFANITPNDNSLIEGMLSAQIRGYRLLAKYDLIHWDMDQPGPRVTIYDWKTSQRRPSRQWLADRLQTKVYPYLLIQAGAPVIVMSELEPEQIEMVYWFADHPQEEQRFSYSTEEYEQDHEYLTGLVDQINALGEDDFELTPDESHCKFCTYRSLCDRGTAPGILAEMEIDQGPESEDDFELDFDQIAEIEF
jgi:CRISPR/Cas system-associated exonuclease Cas4 (RecB family)